MTSPPSRFTRVTRPLPSGSGSPIACPCAETRNPERATNRPKSVSFYLMAIRMQKRSSNHTSARQATPKPGRFAHSVRESFETAVFHALAQHRASGRTVPVMENGQVVWIEPARQMHGGRKRSSAVARKSATVRKSSTVRKSGRAAAKRKSGRGRGR
jgi:hypothetical protein